MIIYYLLEGVEFAAFSVHIVLVDLVSEDEQVLGVRKLDNRLDV